MRQEQFNFALPLNPNVNPKTGIPGGRWPEGGIGIECIGCSIDDAKAESTSIKNLVLVFKDTENLNLQKTKWLPLPLSLLGQAPGEHDDMWAGNIAAWAGVLNGRDPQQFVQAGGLNISHDMFLGRRGNAYTRHKEDDQGRPNDDFFPLNAQDAAKAHHSKLTTNGSRPSATFQAPSVAPPPTFGGQPQQPQQPAAAPAQFGTQPQAAPQQPPLFQQQQPNQFAQQQQQQQQPLNPPTAPPGAVVGAQQLDSLLP